MLKTTVAITGVSIASALGRSWQELGAAIDAGRVGIIRAHRYEPWIKSPLGELPLQDWGVPEAERLHSDPVMRHILLGTCDQLARDTGVFQRYDKTEIGLFLGTTTCGIDGFFAAVDQHRRTDRPLMNFLSPAMQQVWIAHQLRENFPLAGPYFTFSSSCAAAAQAIGQAYDAIRSGICKAAIAGGIDILNRVTLHGFDSLQILDPDFCRPFAADRKGINLGEGGALLLLEADPQDQPLGRICGYAALSEAHHMVQPAPDGIWMEKTMEKALKAAHWSAASIEYINAHGTGTEGNDRAEEAAISRVFGTSRHLHATKGLTGHALGAAGALEAAITLARLQRSGERRAISNSFGFGGSNVSLLIGGAD